MDQNKIVQNQTTIFEARQGLFNAIEAEIQVREILKHREAELMMSGAIIGKNAEARDAQLREGTAAERASLTKAEFEKRHAALALECALDERRCLENCIRIEEIGKT